MLHHHHSWLGPNTTIHNNTRQQQQLETTRNNTRQQHQLETTRNRFPRRHSSLASLSLPEPPCITWDTADDEENNYDENADDCDVDDDAVLDLAELAAQETVLLKL